MNRQEFEHIVKELRPLMFDVGMRYFRSREDAEDVAQESLLLLWKYCEQMDATRNVQALAIKVAKNYCVSTQRRKRVNTIPLTDQTDRAIVQPDVDKVELPLHLLAPRERELFELRQLDGLSTDEIAATKNIKKETVQSMVSAARKKLYEELKRRMRQ